MKVVDKINQKLTEGETFYSFEYFPPKTQNGISNLLERIERMKNLNPIFVDITWGAGGRTSESTLFIASYIQNYLHLDVLMHLTCRCQTKENMDYALEQAKANNIRNILALRGDPPQDMKNYDSSKDYFQYAEDLIKYIREKYGDYFCIVVAGYPATHEESKNKEEDLLYLKRKIDAGGEAIITQLCYDPDEFLTYVDDVRKIGIEIPILPGLLPVNNYNSFKKILTLCKIRVPKNMADEMENVKHNEDKIKEYGIAQCCDMIKKLTAGGIRGFHFYTMNLEKSTTEIIERLGIKLKSSYKKELPFKKRLDSNETVRPIFWSKCPKSYISKTWYWDEHPNGLWGDERSPAFGNNEEHLHTFGIKIEKNSTALKKLWGEKVTCNEDINKLFINYVQGKVKYLPWNEEVEMSEETLLMQNLLVKMNSNSLWTINSQPAVNAQPSEDPVLGWGPDGGYVYQRAYVEFFISRDMMINMTQILNKYPKIIYQAVDLEGNHLENFKENNLICGLTWGVFPNMEIRQPTVYDSEVFLYWKDEAFGKFDNWARIYDENDKETLNFLKKTKENVFLMTIIDNDYVNPKVDHVINEFLDNIKDKNLNGHQNGQEKTI